MVADEVQKETTLEGQDQPPQDMEGFLLGLEWEEIGLEQEGCMRGEPAEELVSIQVHLVDPTKIIKIGALLHKDAQEDFKAFLRKNSDVFAWLYEDMPGINWSVIAHCLNVDLQHRPVMQ